MRCSTILVSSLSLTILCGLAGAQQWTLVRLQPPTQQSSSAQAVQGGQQVGWTRVDPRGPSHAALWSGSAASWIDLHPFAAGSSAARAVYQGRQGGIVEVNGVNHASMWSRSAASWIDLHPPGTTASGINAMHGDEQGGSVGVTQPFPAAHAALWHGTSDWIDLHPVQGGASAVFAVHSGRQAGDVSSTRTSAYLWSGSAESAVDLGPDGIDFSTVTGMDETHQVGFYWSPDQHACMWTGTKESFVDLNPPDAQQSIAWGAGSGYQAGAFLPANAIWAVACIWSGTPESVVNLGVLAPGSQSYATDVWAEGQRIYVVGYIESYPDGIEAVMWVRKPPCPADLDGDDEVSDADFSIFAREYDIMRCSDVMMTSHCPADFNRDQYVDDADFQIFVLAYNERMCP